MVPDTLREPAVSGGNGDGSEFGGDHGGEPLLAERGSAGVRGAVPPLAVTGNQHERRGQTGGRHSPRQSTVSNAEARGVRPFRTPW